MSIEINIPDIGTDEVEITEILVKLGDQVDVEQSLMIVEGEKASIEIPSPQAGVIKEIKVAVGDKVTNGKLIMLLDTEPKVTTTSASNQQDNRQNTNIKNIIELKEVCVPDIGNDEVEVTDIMIKIGDQISTEQSLITVEGEKASIEVPAPFVGEVKEIKIAKGDKVKTGSVIMMVAVKSPTEQHPSAEIINKSAATYSQSSNDSSNKNISGITDHKFIKNDAYVHATPLIRRLAREFGVNLAKVKGTGRKGRILREDIQVYVKKAVKSLEYGTAATADCSGILPWPTVDFRKFGTVEEVELGRIQKISSANLSRNWLIIPHVTVMDKADITEVESFRQQKNQEMNQLQTRIKITMLVLVMKTVARVLEEMPRFNSSISADIQRLTLKKYVNIGIAVDTPNGLVVPVINNVNKKGILDLSKELLTISNKARAGKLTVSDMQGGSLTISNLGGIGLTSFTPIINAPEVAILGLARSSIQPVWNGSKFIARLMLPMSLAFDHRVIDGADGARFITRIAQLMSDIYKPTKD